MVVVRGDAVAAITVQIQTYAVERRADAVDYASRRIQDGGRREAGWLIEPEVANQPRYVDLAVVHHPPLGAPLDDAAQLPEPLVRGGGVDETWHVRDSSSLVVHEHPLARFEEGRLRHGNSACSDTYLVDFSTRPWAVIAFFRMIAAAG